MIFVPSMSDQAVFFEFVCRIWLTHDP